MGTTVKQAVRAISALSGAMMAASSALAEDNAVFDLQIGRYIVEACSGDGYRLQIAFAMRANVEVTGQNIEFPSADNVQGLMSGMPAGFQRIAARYGRDDLREDPVKGAVALGETLHLLQDESARLSRDLSLDVYPLLITQGVSNRADCTGASLFTYDQPPFGL